jgi:hypothetical protein
MNEQAKSKLHKLANQCKNPDNYHQGPWMDYIQFAELIIQDCLQQARIVQQQKIENAPDDYHRGREMGLEVLVNNLIKRWS